MIFLKRFIWWWVGLFALVLCVFFFVCIGRSMAWKRGKQRLVYILYTWDFCKLCESINHSSAIIIVSYLYPFASDLKRLPLEFELTASMVRLSKLNTWRLLETKNGNRIQRSGYIWMIWTTAKKEVRLQCQVQYRVEVSESKLQTYERKKRKPALYNTYTQDEPLLLPESTLISKSCPFACPSGGSVFPGKYPNL